MATSRLLYLTTFTLRLLWKRGGKNSGKAISALTSPQRKASLKRRASLCTSCLCRRKEEELSGHAGGRRLTAQRRPSCQARGLEAGRPGRPATSGRISSWKKEENTIYLREGASSANSH